MHINESAKTLLSLAENAPASLQDIAQAWSGFSATGIAGTSPLPSFWQAVNQGVSVEYTIERKSAGACTHRFLQVNADPVFGSDKVAVAGVLVVIRAVNSFDSYFAGQHHPADIIYHQMVEAVEDYVIVFLDASGNVCNWNRGAERIKGYTANEIIGKSFKVFYTQEAVASGLPGRLLAEAARDGRTTDEGWRVRKDGTRFWATVLLTAIFNEKNEVTGFTKVTRDITLRRDAEQQVLQLNEKLQRANAELEQFAYIASHDLQEPLRMVSSFIRLLEMKYKDQLDDTAREYIRIAVSGATRMKQLIDDFMEMVRINNESRLELSEFDSEELVHEVVQIRLAEYKYKNVQVKTFDLPVIVANRKQVRQVFMQLIANALQHGVSADPVIEIGCTDEGQNWQFYVKDNGPGIDPQYHERIFLLFKKLQREEDQRNTGIGLAVCKKIVEFHDGAIWVNSDPGKGASFYFTLPKRELNRSHE